MESPLNPMVFHLRFSHITEQIFENMDSKSLKNCREVSKSWQICIDNRNILWNKMVKKNSGNKAFQLACNKGHTKMAQMLIQKPAWFNIDLNAKDKYGWTAFHWACWNGQSNIAEMLIQKSVDFNIDINSEWVRWVRSKFRNF